jgi:nifR3 family TIM-barrel protein
MPDSPPSRIESAAFETERIHAPPVRDDRLAEITHEPWNIGARMIDFRYGLAPLAGYTQRPFRVALRELGGLGLATTDLVHAGKLLVGNAFSKQLIATSERDRPLSVQLFGAEPAHVATAARWLEDLGYGGIDLNMGCPMAKVNGSGGGARLMCDPAGATNLVAQVVSAVSIPVTVKMRLGWDARSLSAPQLARQFEDAGAAAITIHGRTRAQGFTGQVSREGIAATVAAVRSIPVIGNGDVRTVEDALSMRRETGCAAVAIGRGAMLDPWIFRKLRDFVETGHYHEPEPKEQIDFLVTHFREMESLFGDKSTQLFRKFAGWYGARLGIPLDLEDRLRRCGSLAEFDEIVAEIRERHGHEPCRVPTALIKVPNGPNELW